MADTIHVVEGLGVESGGDGDDTPAGGGVAVEQPGEEVGLELILAGLARQDDDEGETAVVDDEVLDGAGDLDLIGTQVDTAGMRPGDGAAADGGAEGIRKEWTSLSTIPLKNAGQANTKYTREEVRRNELRVTSNKKEEKRNVPMRQGERKGRWVFQSGHAIKVSTHTLLKNREVW